MRVITLPAVYAPLVAAVLARLEDEITRHADLSARSAASPDFEARYNGLLGQLADNLVARDQVDPSRPGMLVITIADLPEDQDAKVFTLPQPLKAAS